MIFECVRMISEYAAMMREMQEKFICGAKRQALRERVL
jgi:hypothetical protein